MLQTIRNAWKVPELRKKIVFVLFILLIYRLGALIPVPFVNAGAISGSLASMDLSSMGGIFAYMDLLSGGALAQGTLFALGVSPYINASIIVQLLTVAIKPLEQKAQQGEEGKKFINSLTRYITVFIAIVTALGYYFILKNYGLLDGSIVGSNIEWFYAIVIILCFCAGASIVMWLAEKINENGLGNGISLILFANIIASLPSIVRKLVLLFQTSDAAADYAWTSAITAVVLLLLVGLTIFVIYVTGSERRIPIQYAKRTVGRKMYGGQSSNLPIKLNMTGVMPIIFASSICSLPATIMMFANVQPSASVTKPTVWNRIYDFCNTDGLFYAVMLFILIIAFSYFYIQISFNPIEVSNNLKKNGGVIPGIRQGRPTAEFVSRILNRITLAGAIFLGIVALLPIILKAAMFVPAVSQIVANTMYASSVQYFTSAFTFGGTSILIVVGVVQETARELESQLTMRNYKGFLN